MMNFDLIHHFGRSTTEKRSVKAGLAAFFILTISFVSDDKPRDDSQFLVALELGKRRLYSGIPDLSSRKRVKTIDRRAACEVPAHEHFHCDS
jgi:hypothetical protein